MLNISRKQSCYTKVSRQAAYKFFATTCNLLKSAKIFRGQCGTETKFAISKYMVRHKQNWHDGTHSAGGVSQMCLHFGRGPLQEINNITMKILAMPKMRQMLILLK